MAAPGDRVNPSLISVAPRSSSTTIQPHPYHDLRLSPRQSPHQGTLDTFMPEQGLFVNLEMPDPWAHMCFLQVRRKGIPQYPPSPILPSHAGASLCMPQDTCTHLWLCPYSLRCNHTSVLHAFTHSQWLPLWLPPACTTMPLPHF